LLLREGADITKDDVFSALTEYTYNRAEFDNDNVAGYEYTFGVSIEINMKLLLCIILFKKKYNLEIWTFCIHKYSKANKKL